MANAAGTRFHGLYPEDVRCAFVELSNGLGELRSLLTVISEHKAAPEEIRNLAMLGYRVSFELENFADVQHEEVEHGGIRHV